MAYLASRQDPTNHPTDYQTDREVQNYGHHGSSQAFALAVAFGIGLIDCCAARHE